MMAETADSGRGPSYRGTLVIVVAIAIAAFVLSAQRSDQADAERQAFQELVDNQKTDQTRALREEFRELIVKLQQSMAGGSVNRESESGAQPWIYFEAARKLEQQIPDEMTIVDYLVLSSFSFGHSDLHGGDAYAKKALKMASEHPSATTSTLAHVALGHMHFKYAPKTDIASGRKYYQKAFEMLEKLEGERKFFIESSIHQEWALDEYASGNEKEGDEQLLQSQGVMKNHDLPERYLKSWETDLDGAVIKAKVSGGLL